MRPSWLNLNLYFAKATMGLRRFSYVPAGASGVFLCLYVYRMIVLPQRRQDQAHKAIHGMVRAGAWYELRQFLEAGQAGEFGVLLDIIKPDQMADGQAPLYIAAHQGHEKCVQLLLDAGAVCFALDCHAHTRGRPHMLAIFFRSLATNPSTSCPGP